MLTKLLLALRNNGHEVAVVKINGETRPQLGRAHPEDDEPRARALRQWGVDSSSPRRVGLGTIDEPLPRRTQTVLSYRIAPELRRRIDSGIGGLGDSREGNRAGVRERATLSTGDDD